jgi:FtsZ-binding cell division protein ZapB
MEFEGSVLQPNFRQKEKMYNAKIFSLNQIIEELRSDLSIAYDTINIHKEEIKELKEEVKATKVRYRNFKAQAIAPKLAWKEKPNADNSFNNDVQRRTDSTVLP